MVTREAIERASDSGVVVRARDVSAIARLGPDPLGARFDEAVFANVVAPGRRSVRLSCSAEVRSRTDARLIA